MNFDPLVSIIVTCFNREDTILRALQSIKSQTYKNLEIIIVDDASSDNSSSKIYKFIKINPNLKINFIPLEINLGQVNGLNVAVENCTGDFIFFLDSDDYYEKNFLSSMTAAFNKEFSDFVYCELINGPSWSLEGCDIYHEVLGQGYLSSLGTLGIRSSVAKKIFPVPTNLLYKNICQDDYLCFELAKNFCCVHVSEQLYNIGISDNQSTDNKYDVIRGWYVFFSLYRDDIIKIVSYQAWFKHISKLIFDIFYFREYKLFYYILFSELKNSLLISKNLK